MDSGNACYHSVQCILSSLLLSRTVKVNIFKTIILPVVLYGREIWSVTLREEHILRVFENRVLRRILDQTVTGEWRKLHKESFIFYTPPQLLLGKSNQGE
jgi:hypothetical protein